MLAVKLDPDSPKIQQMLAKTELVFGEYETSSRRLTWLLETLSRDKNASSDMVISCREVRGRSAFLAVEQKLNQKATSVGEESVQRLKFALGDLKKCEIFLSNATFGTEEDALRRYHVCHDQARATLTLAEVELALGKRKDASRHLGDSRDLIKMTTALAPGVKMPEPTSLSRRLSDVQNRLENPESDLASSQSRLAPNRSSRLGARSG
jgi:hypothetical protein